MTLLRLCSLALLGVTSIACDALLDRPEPAPRKRTPVEVAIFEGEPDESIPCQADADCPASACGPCTPGQVFERRHFRVDCKMDPCRKGTRSVCGAEQVCVVGPAPETGPQ